jgi:hypothetical protein
VLAPEEVLGMWATMQSYYLVFSVASRCFEGNPTQADLYYVEKVSGTTMEYPFERLRVDAGYASAA